MYKIKIQEHVSIQDIDQLWKPKGDVAVIFDITHASSFGLFAEGVALGKLRDFDLGGFKIGINLQQSPLLNKEKGKETVDIKKLPPILTTLFGLELLHLSTSVEVLGDDLGLNLRSLIGNLIWGEAKRNKGVINLGKSIYLVSRHGYEIPVALRQSSSLPKQFPALDSFQKNIRPFVTELRSGDYSSETEKQLIEWVFHCAENSLEHAADYKEVPIEGYRGIVLQKIKFEIRNDLQKRKDIPDVVKNYLSQRMKDGELGKDLITNVITVIDLGPGIQNTVPISAAATSLERLQYAFKDGVTSKNTNDHEKAGYGLGQAANAARHLKALLFIVSANEVAFYDFSDEDEKQIPGQELELTHIGEIGKYSGSAVSLLWVYNPKNEDQLGMKI